MTCEVRSVRYNWFNVWSAKCRVLSVSVKCRVRKIRCTVQTVKCKV